MESTISLTQLQLRGTKMESDFSKKVITKLKADGWNCQRIESSMTGLGIPDLVVMRGGLTCFIELKQEKQSKNARELNIHWRPGQQAWANNYSVHMINPRNNTIQYSWTFADMKDGFVAIRMDRLFEDNKVLSEASSVFKDYDMTELLLTHSQVPIGICTASCMMVRYLELFGVDETIDYDLWAGTELDPTVIVNPWDIRKIAEYAFSTVECWNKSGQKN